MSTTVEQDLAPSPIYTTSELASAVADGRVPQWEATAYEELRAKVADEHFPCTFGTVALRQGSILFSYLRQHDQLRQRGLATTAERIAEPVAALLAAYALRLASMPSVVASMTPLAIFIRPPDGVDSLDDYQRLSFEILTCLRRLDPEAWPTTVTEDPDSPDWSFCFAGTAFFVNFKTPAHRARRSRRMQRSFLLLIQARDGFDILAGDTPHGRRARRIIREKLTAYDGMAPHPALAHFGTDDNREWRQYFLPDDNETTIERCPFHRS